MIANIFPEGRWKHNTAISKLRSWTFQISNIQSIKLEDIQNPQTRLKKKEITGIKRPTQEGMTIIKDASPAFWTAGNPPTSWRPPSSDPTTLLPLVSDQEIAENLNRRLAGGSADLRVGPGLLDYFFRIANFGNVSKIAPRCRRSCWVTDAR